MSKTFQQSVRPTPLLLMAEFLWSINCKHWEIWIKACNISAINRRGQYMDTTWSRIFDWHLAFIVRPKSFVQPPSQQVRNMMPCSVVCCWLQWELLRQSAHYTQTLKAKPHVYSLHNSIGQVEFTSVLLSWFFRKVVCHKLPHTGPFTPKPSLGEQR